MGFSKEIKYCNIFCHGVFSNVLKWHCMRHKPLILFLSLAFYSDQLFAWKIVFITAQQDYSNKLVNI